MSADLYNKLKVHSKKDVYPFHMPGHKMGRGMNFENPWEADITEIDGFDNLHHPQGIIEKAQKKAAVTFGADETFFCVNGSSGSIIASIMACGKENEKIIAARNCHKSVFSGMVLSGAVPIYVMPENIENFGIAGGIKPEKIEQAVDENPDAKAVILTSPTAEGVVSDIEKIAEIVHEKNMLLIVDEAHGAHFKFNEYFPKTALEMGADIVIQSVHKTLPAPTQTSLVHVRGKRVDVTRLKETLSMIQSTSPSYVFMGAMDLCREYLDKSGKKDFKAYVEKVKKIRNELSSLKKFKLLDESCVGNYGVKELDLGKLVLSAEKYDCVEISEILNQKYGIALEMSCPGYFMALTSVCDSDDGFVRLIKALKEIDKMQLKTVMHNTKSIAVPKAVMIKTPREAFNSKIMEIDFLNCVGHVAGEFAVPYPPGIPVCVPGELITDEVKTILEKSHKYGVEIIGMKYDGLEKIVILE